MAVTNVVGAVDKETRTGEADHRALRLWLRLLTCTTLIENDVRARLRQDFSTTLPRFDLMAQLARHPDGLKMGELSQRLMVSGGNITGLTDQLEREGWVERVAEPGDRRAFRVRLTPAGRDVFAQMAVTHEGWIVAMMEALSPLEQQELYTLLGKLKHAVREPLDLAEPEGR